MASHDNASSTGIAPPLDIKRSAWLNRHSASDHVYPLHGCSGGWRRLHSEKDASMHEFSELELDENPHVLSHEDLEVRVAIEEAMKRFFADHMHTGQDDESDEEPMIAQNREGSIYVNNLTGDKEYKVNKSKLPCTVLQLKQCLAIAWGAPKSMQRIVAGSDVINDSDGLHAGMTHLTMVLSIDAAIAQLHARDTANLRLRALQDLAKCGLQVDELAVRAIRTCLEDPASRVRHAARRCLQSLRQ